MAQEQASDLFDPFWRGLAAGQLSFPQCPRCGRFHWYPKAKCPHCGMNRIVWTVVSPRGRLYTWTVVRHAFAPEYQDKLPYIVGLVVFDEAPGVRLVTNLVGAEPDELTFDMPVIADFASADAQHRVTFLPAPGATTGPRVAESSR